MERSKKIASMSVVFAMISGVLAAFLIGCAGIQPKKEAPQQARCNETPQWNTRDEKGNHISIFICFGEKNQLLYSARITTPPPPAPAAESPKKKK